MDKHEQVKYPAFGYFVIQKATEYPEKASNASEKWANVIVNLTGKTAPEKWKKRYQWLNSTSPQFKSSKQNISLPSAYKEPMNYITTPVEDKAVDSKNTTEESSSHVQEEVTLCVIDDARKRQDSFLCPRRMLLREMPYFEKFMESEEDVEVQFSVHCDIEVFKRLLLYASKDEIERKKFLIEPKYAIHMLVSAEFLQMEELIEECLKFCHQHMNLLLSMSGIIGLLGETLLHRLAMLFRPDDVDALDDKQDKIKSKLYRKLAENLAKTASNGPYSAPLVDCSLCGKVFSEKIAKYVRCLPSRMTINKYGELYPDHKLEKKLEFDKMMQNLLHTLGHWKLVYWRIWGTVHTLSCTVCARMFPCCEFLLCRHHVEPAKFNCNSEHKISSHVQGEFPCCGRKTFRFVLLDPLQTASGCSFKMHTVAQRDKVSDVYGILMSHKDGICTADPPNIDDHPDYETLCKWSEDRISRPPQRNSRTGGATYRNENAERSLQQRLLPGRDGPVLRHSERFFDDKMLWNPTNSVWHNQDTLREYDGRCLDALVAHLKQHGSKKT